MKLGIKAKAREEGHKIIVIFDIELPAAEQVYIKSTVWCTQIVKGINTVNKAFCPQNLAA